ncbi:MAG: glycoside hydrolase domain-containing protein, partial [Anaerohalosphaeraceae bacterium]
QYWSRAYITDVTTNLYHNHGLFPSPVVRRVYENKPAGWLPTMDDDTGAMSSHFVFSALGLYPACMGDSYYVIGSPLFPEAALHLAHGKTFVIRANHSTLANRYIQSAKLNGKPYDKTWIDFKTIQAGGVLEFEMSDQPNPEWGKAPGSMPPSLSSADKQAAK